MTMTATGSGIEIGRLRRALALKVAPAGRGSWLISGGAEPHHVTRAGDFYACDCVDFRLRGGTCKHIAASRLFDALDAELLAALRELVADT